MIRPLLALACALVATPALAQPLPASPHSGGPVVPPSAAAAVGSPSGAIEGYRETGSTSAGWDGSAWLVTARTVLTYDADGRLVEDVLERRDGSGWTPAVRVENAFDDAGRPVGRLAQQWTAGGWENYNRVALTYDEAGNLAEFVDQRWEEDAWRNHLRNAWVYDDAGRWIEAVSQPWDGSAWVDGVRGRAAYNPAGDPTQITNQRWTGEDWANSLRYVYAYDGSGNRTEDLTQTWDDGAWANDSRTTYDVDDDGNRLAELRQDWDGTAWANDGRTLHTYDDAANRTRSLRQTWRNAEWANRQLDATTFDGPGNPAIEIQQLWDGTAWVNQFRRSATFALVAEAPLTPTLSWQATRANTLSRLVIARGAFDPDAPGGSSGALVLDVTVDATSHTVPAGVLEPGTTYAWRVAPTVDGDQGPWSAAAVFTTAAGVQRAAGPDGSLDVQVGPNPLRAGGEVAIDLPEAAHVRVTVYDLLGREVGVLAEGVRAAGRSRVDLGAEALAAGAYVVRVTAGAATGSARFSVAR